MFNFLRGWGSEHRYERPLPELISLSLDKGTLEQLVTNINRKKPISKLRPPSTDGTKYIEKLLSEQVEKQFTEEYRPFIELIANAIDARPKDLGDKNYTVNVDIGSNRFVVDDTGKSMGLRDILQTFIIPFSTDKDRLQDIGRFGVGFFPNLLFCLDKPKEGRLVVDTNDGKGAYRLTFWSESNSVEGLRVKIERGSKRQRGTRVEIRGYPIKENALTKYISDYMQYFDPKRAKIKLGWNTVNPLPKGVTYWGNETFETSSGTVSQIVRSTINPAKWSRGGLKMYSQGVFILEKELRDGEFRLDFPSAVEIVEGRDEFKQDENYWKAIDKAYDLILQYAKKYGIKDQEIRAILRDMVPAIREELGKDLGYERNKGLVKLLFPEKTYLLEDHYSDYCGDYDNAVRFFGRGILPLVYKPGRKVSADFWRGVLPGLSSLVSDETEVLAEGSLDTLRQAAQQRGKPLNNVDVLRSPNINYALVNLKTSEGGISPFIQAGYTVYVKLGHPFFAKPDFVSRYGVFTTYEKARGNEEEEIEKEILRA